VPWTISKGQNTYNRFYHFFSKNELKYAAITKINADIVCQSSVMLPRHIKKESGRTEKIYVHETTGPDYSVLQPPPTEDSLSTNEDLGDKKESEPVVE